MTNELTKIDIIVTVIFILLIGAYFGASYADMNWKHDLKEYSKNNTNFQFDMLGKYYTIHEHSLIAHERMDYQNITFYVNTSTVIKQ